jgi:hypothetical protein
VIYPGGIMKRVLTILLSIVILAVSNNLFAEESGPESYHPKWIGWFRAGYDHDFTAGADGGFNNYSARIIAKGKYDERISYHIMTEMVNQSSSDSRPIFLQGWIEYRLTEQISARIGQYKYPFGREAYGPVMAWKFANPSYVTAGIAKKLGRSGGLFRDVGMEIEASERLNENAEVFSKLMVMNGNGINDLDSNSDKDLVGQAGLEILPYGIEFGGSYFAGKDPHGYEYAVNGYFIFKNSGLHAQAEYSRAIYETIPYQDIEPAGFYAFATYQVYTGIETGIRYDRYESDINSDNTDRDRISLMAAYNFSGLTRIMLNYEVPGGTLNEREDREHCVSLNFYVAFD